jgi:electron transport complex protein RnfC
MSFKGGVHPPHSKAATEHKPIEILPPPPKVIIPLSQHIGAPAKLVVKRGDDVKIGQLLGEAGGFVSSPVFSSVSGKVLSISPFPHPLGNHVLAVEIENDGKDECVEFTPFERPWREAAPGELINAIASAGVVGMGGASFPTHVKLSPPSEKKIDTLIINAAECEPYLTADHRLMVEKTDDLLNGILILRKILGAEKTYIGIEINKPDAIAALSAKLSDSDYKGITLVKLKAKYPQGGEKQLIQAITGRQVPSGGLPMDVGCVVQNVGTACAVSDAILRGMPLYQRVTTVTGPTVKQPKNLLIRIGTPLSYVLQQCDTDMSATRKVIMGGPMMGIAQSELETPVIKSTSGILAYDKVTPAIRQYNCINCGNCSKACPISLVPSQLAKLIEYQKYDSAEEWNVLDCIECGSCAFVCPAKINLVHFMKLGKFHIHRQRKLAARPANTSR